MASLEAGEFHIRSLLSWPARTSSSRPIEIKLCDWAALGVCLWVGTWRSIPEALGKLGETWIRSEAAMNVGHHAWTDKKVLFMPNSINKIPRLPSLLRSERCHRCSMLIYAGSKYWMHEYCDIVHAENVKYYRAERSGGVVSSWHTQCGASCRGTTSCTTSRESEREIGGIGILNALFVRRHSTYCWAREPANMRVLGLGIGDFPRPSSARGTMFLGVFGSLATEGKEDCRPVLNRTGVPGFSPSSRAFAVQNRSSGL